MYTLIFALSLAEPVADVCVTDCHWFGVSKAVLAECDEITPELVDGLYADVASNERRALE